MVLAWNYGPQIRSGEAYSLARPEKMEMGEEYSMQHLKSGSISRSGTQSFQSYNQI